MFGVLLSSIYLPTIPKYVRNCVFLVEGNSSYITDLTYIMTVLMYLVVTDFGIVYPHTDI